MWQQMGLYHVSCDLYWSVYFEDRYKGRKHFAGLGHECREIAHSIGPPNLVCVTRSKKEIKAAVKQQDRLEVRQRVESSKKVQNRLSDNPEDHSYLNKMPLHTARVWIRVRAYAIKGVKMNQKSQRWIKAHTLDLW